VTAQQQQQWFFSTGGERFGPVGFDYLLELAQGGGLDPRNDWVWSTSMNDWEPAGEVEGLFERRAARREEVGSDSAHGLAQTGSHEAVPIPRAQPAGTGRVGFVMGAFLLPLMLAVGWQFLVPLLKVHVPPEYAGYLPWVVWPLVAWLSVTTHLKRFQSLGMSRWWLFGLIVPLMNLWLGFRLLAAPAGYARQRKLDGVGTLVAFVYWGLILGSVGLMVASMLGSLGELKESGVIDDVTRQIEDLRKSAQPER